VYTAICKNKDEFIININKKIKIDLSNEKNYIWNTFDRILKEIEFNYELKIKYKNNTYSDLDKLTSNYYIYSLLKNNINKEIEKEENIFYINVLPLDKYNWINEFYNYSNNVESKDFDYLEFNIKILSKNKFSVISKCDYCQKYTDKIYLCNHCDELFCEKCNYI